MNDFEDLGSVRFNADDETGIELNIDVGDRDPEEEPEDRPARVEFVREVEDHVVEEG